MGRGALYCWYLSISLSLCNSIYMMGKLILSHNIFNWSCQIFVTLRFWNLEINLYIIRSYLLNITRFCFTIKDDIFNLPRVVRMTLELSRILCKGLIVFFKFACYLMITMKAWWLEGSVECYLFHHWANHGGDQGCGNEKIIYSIFRKVNEGLRLSPEM